MRCLLGCYWVQVLVERAVCLYTIDCHARDISVFGVKYFSVECFGLFGFRS